MTETDLRTKTVSGMLWSGVGRFGAIALNFLSNLVLARLLMPEDFGTIGMLYVFIALSNEFILAGFGSALIQKKQPTCVDYTSVFWWNLAASVLFYGILYLSGPAIARYYAMPQLCPLLRVQSLSVIILAFTLVPSFWMQKQFRFKELSMRQLLATGVGTVVGISMALGGCGVWSLVASNLAGNLSGMLLLWHLCDWRPSRVFSLQSLRELFRFGGLMALSSLLSVFYANVQNLIIGKRYSAGDLGYYSQARKLEDVPVTALAQVFNQVTFPLFSDLQDERGRFLQVVRQNVRTTSYLVFPLLALLFVIARPLVVLLYGAKWEPSVTYLQILCLCGMIGPLNALNTNIIKSLGHSGLYFVSLFVTRVLGIGLIFFGAGFGIVGLVWAVVATEYICLLVSWFINGRLVGYGAVEQLRDVGVPYLLAVVLAAAVLGMGRLLPLHPYVTMLVQVLVYAAAYVLISHLLDLPGYQMSRTIVREKFGKKL